MRYTKELSDLISRQYQEGMTVSEIAANLSVTVKETVPDRSIIAKLSSLGVYKKREYLTKRGEIPVKKSEIIERLATLLEVNPDILESLEKVNKSVLNLLEVKLSTKKLPEVEEYNIFK
jgi:hypothetical protein